MLEDYLRRLLLASPAGLGTFDMKQLLSNLQQKASPITYLLHAVQAGVALQAREISIKVTRRKCQIEFGGFLEFELSPQALHQDGDLETRGQQYLRATWYALLASQPLDFRLKWRSVAHSFDWSLKDGLQDHGSGFVRVPVSKLRLEATIVPGGPWGFIKGIRDRLRIASELAWRCALCPVPVRLDGRLLNAPFPQSLSPLKVRSNAAPLNPARADCRWAVEEVKAVDVGAGFALGSYRARKAAAVYIGADRFPKEGSFLGPHCAVESRLEGAKVPKQPYEQQAPFLGVLPREGDPLAMRAKFGLFVGCLLKGYEGKETSFCASRWLAIPNHPLVNGQLWYLEDGILLDPVEVPDVNIQAILWNKSGLLNYYGLTPASRSDSTGQISWLRTQADRLSGHIKVEPENVRYEPDVSKIWQTYKTLSPDVDDTNRFQLGPAHQVFDIDRRFDENVELSIGWSDGTLDLVCGAQASQRKLTVCKLTDLTGIELDWHNYLHKKERAVQVRLTLVCDHRKMCFQLGGNEKTVKSHKFQTRLLGWLRELAKQCSLELDVRRPDEALW